MTENVKKPVGMSQLEDNFNLLLKESLGQLQRTFAYIESFDPGLHEKIVERDDYIDNLKLTIENQCFSTLSRIDAAEREQVAGIRARQAICVNLEKIADYCVNICKQVDYLHDRDFWLGFPYQPMCRLVTATLNLVERAIRDGDISLAMQICRSEPDLDDLFSRNFKTIMEHLHRGNRVDTCVTILFIFRYMERMGDSLLNIGEAILLSILGEKIKIRQFEALQQTISKSSLPISVDKPEVDAFLGTRSGCNISRVAGDHKDEDGKTRSHEGLFKSGSPQKIIQEKNNLERWAAIRADLVPRIYTFHDEGDRVSMLVEFLPGQTLESILITCPWEEINRILLILQTNIEDIWQKTMDREGTAVDYMRQLKKRYPAVLEVHPRLFRGEQELGALKVQSTAALITRAAQYEEQIRAPFTVFGHGDFNLNNIIFDQEKNRLHYIDLYRSHRADYVEDVAVFLISNFRLPVFADNLRHHLNRTIATMLAFARDFARKTDDPTFALRLTLALARSFITSTRFEQNRKFAREMALRGTYLLEKVVKHGAEEAPEDFVLPEKVLYYQGS